VADGGEYRLRGEHYSQGLSPGGQSAPTIVVPAPYQSRSAGGSASHGGRSAYLFW
jgi:hypothetical protein